MPWLLELLRTEPTKILSCPYGKQFLSKAYFPVFLLNNTGFKQKCNAYQLLSSVSFCILTCLLLCNWREFSKIQILSSHCLNAFLCLVKLNTLLIFPDLFLKFYTPVKMKHSQLYWHRAPYLWGFASAAFACGMLILFKFPKSKHPTYLRSAPSLVCTRQCSLTL
jgi:hypothetical protein